MAKNMKISNESAIAAINAVTALLNNGSIKIYSGAQPADVSVAATGTLLATLPLSATAFPTAVDDTGSAKATANAVTTDANATAGTAGYFRAFKTDGTTGVLDGTVGTATSDMILDKVILDAGDDVVITLWEVTHPE